MDQLTQIVIGGLVQGIVFAIVALGMSLVYRVTGIINLAQGGFCVVAALGYYQLSQVLGWPPVWAFVVAALATTVFGLLVGAATFVPALSRLPNSSMLMLTAGLLTFLQGLTLVIWGSQPYAVAPFSGEQPITLAGIRFPSQGPWIVGVAAVVVLGTWYLLTRTASGKALLACAENPHAARLMGIDVSRLTLLSFGLTALIAALGGIAVAPIISLEFDTGGFFTNAGFIAVAIGGMSSLVGSVGGGLFLGVAEQLAAGYVSSLFSNALALALLLVTLLWRPQGLFMPRRTRRLDVREDVRVYRAIVRFRGARAAAIGLVALAVLIALPHLVGEGGLLSSLVITGILFIGVLGLDVLMGYAGQVSLGQAAFLAIGGYTAAILATTYDFSPLVGTLAGMAVSLVCAILLSLVTMRLRGAYLALATLSFGLLVDSLTVGLNITGGPSGLVGIPSFAIGSYSFDSDISMYYLVLALIVVLVAALYGGMRSSFGRALQAIRTDQTAAAALGIDVPRHKMAAFAISALLGSLCGSLYAFDFHFLSPEMVSTPRSFEMIAMQVVGGEGMLVGGLVGSALITLLPTIFQPLAAYKTLAEGAILVLAFQYLPDGIVGTIARWLTSEQTAKAATGRLAAKGEA
ncbi:MAG: ABC transporter permease [Alphaproteobacteria bacterium]|nr:ABC transporter permease [Alphaproteobacteria bacterium]